MEDDNMRDTKSIYNGWTMMHKMKNMEWHLSSNIELKLMHIDKKMLSQDHKESEK